VAGTDLSDLYLKAIGRFLVCGLNGSADEQGSWPSFGEWE
jgi:hypothetical protein